MLPRAYPRKFLKKACSEINSGAVLALHYNMYNNIFRSWSCIHKSSVQTVYYVEFCVLFSIVYLHMCLLTIYIQVNVHVYPYWGGGLPRGEAVYSCWPYGTSHASVNRTLGDTNWLICNFQYLHDVDFTSSLYLCVCVCACVEREKERERGGGGGEDR